MQYRSSSKFANNLLLFLFISQSLFAQTKYWIFLKDKPANSKVELSERALQRRKAQNVPIDDMDKSVNSLYIQQISAMGSPVLRVSKWLNAVSVIANENQLQAIRQLPFVTEIRPVAIWKSHKGKIVESKTQVNYGNSATQNEMLNIQFLHNQGFTGQGKLIGIFDSGFSGANTHRVFRPVFDSNRVVNQYNFVNNNTNVFGLDGHGTSVWSCIGGFSEDTLVGTGYGASFLLAITEDVTSETTAEEDNWLAAMEWADSLGVDIINTSLGYTTMDGGQFYTYAQMDGNTTIITRAADIAASKGILVVVSAGNEGNNDWKKISAPCDADSVLCVGSVNADRNRSSFSSFGPAADGRIKPDVMAMGGQAFVANTSDWYTYSSGTSFSAPVMAGLVASLWQANPTKTNMEIIHAVKMSADRAWSPDTLYGWGIPDAARADSILKGFSVKVDKSQINLWQISPNPVQQEMKIIGNFQTDKIEIQIFNSVGILVKNEELDKNRMVLNVQDLANGLYVLKIKYQNLMQSVKFVKQ